MKLIIPLIFLSFISLEAFAKKGANLNYDSWALLYGQGKLVDGHKKTENLSLTGNNYKFIFSHRESYFDTSAIIGIANYSDDFRYSGIDGEMKHQRATYGFQFGFWPLSWFQLHAGYAYHEILEKFNGGFSASQRSEIEKKYKIIAQKSHGLYGGVDLILVQWSKLQIFANYDYYHHNNLDAHDWTVMGGFRYHLDASKGGGTSGKNFFEKMWGIIFPDPNKR